ncbi:hypothetical protein BX600DRAFT_429054 [Xylariales sp. PMI_506]|nr:hypothetical protein BX600DRAFT_429054 [Xylariales sp. PMI_506]
MTMWPFKRKGSRRRKRSPARGRQATEHDPPLRALTEPVAGPGSIKGSSQGPFHSQRKSQRDSSGSTKKLQRRGRTYSFSPGRQDTIRLGLARQESIPPLPTAPLPAGVSLSHKTQNRSPSGVTGDPYEMDRVPTLHHNNSRNKRRGQALPQRKSSKRRKEDHDREAEIRALSHSRTMPARTAVEEWTSGQPVKRESRRSRPGTAKGWHKPDSDTSLPIPESIDSAMSSDSEHASFRVSALAALAPRPTLRYASNPVYGISSGSGPVRSSSQRRKFSERGAISEATLNAHKRVDDLANGLGASDLRELMDRDKRRRERKRETERERVERRLARRAERQRQAEAEAKRNGTPPPQNLERGVMGRESPPLEVDTTSAVITSTRRRSTSLDSPRKREKRPVVAESEQQTSVPRPLETFRRVDSIAMEPATSTQPAEPKQPRLSEEAGPRSSRSPSPRLLDYIRSKKRRSKSPLQPDQEKAENVSMRIASRSDESELGRRSTSGSSPSRAWLTIFKWARRGKGKRTSVDDPASFSNTSRDSMLASQQPTTQPPAVVNYVPQRSNSKVPKRTMSRFREDLPELPLSPPDSRVASPEADTRPSEPLPIISDNVPLHYDTLTPDYRATPSSMHRDDLQASPVGHSMSLASIDSEGSWLSGGAGRKRASSGMRGSLANYPLRSISGESEDLEHDAINDDDFLKIVDDNKMYRKSSGEAQPSSDEEDDEDDHQSPRWGNVTRMPTITHRRETMQSREGLLLQSFDDDEKEFRIEKDSDDGASFGDSPARPQRATSVNLGKTHGRNFSAGSAKLLEITPRPSVDKRRSINEPVTQ